MKSLKSEKRKALILAAFLLIAVFLAGAATGALLWRFSNKNRVTNTLPPQHGSPHEALNLTPLQERMAHAIGEKYRIELDSIRQKIVPQVEIIHGKMEKELRAILSSEQRKIQDNLPRRMNPPGPPPGHDPMRQGPPPPEAKRACENMNEGSPCKFNTSKGRHISGICRLHPGSAGKICVPSRP